MRDDAYAEQSLSSWRAWIEIASSRWTVKRASESLSSWRAWIEMVSAVPVVRFRQVALLMESVD